MKNLQCYQQFIKIIKLEPSETLTVKMAFISSLRGLIIKNSLLKQTVFNN